MTTALVTGVAGQDGAYLSALLRRKGYRVVGTATAASTGVARLGPYLDGVEIARVDVRDGAAMYDLLVATRPDEVYNLAAHSSVNASWGAAEEVADVNGMAVLRLLEALLRYREDGGVAPRLFQASSSEIFGPADQQPQHERTPHDPRSPYAVAKSFAHHLVVNYQQSRGLFACNGILFNHESPLRPTRFVTRTITRAVAEIALGRRSTLALGNLDARRDWGAAGDYVEAMWLMLQRESPADYVLATGRVASVRDFVTLAFGCVGIDDPWPRVTVDRARLRPADVPQTWGDPSRAAAELGWTATTTLPELVGQMVAADLSRLTGGVEESAQLVGW